MATLGVGIRAAITRNRLVRSRQTGLVYSMCMGTPVNGAPTGFIWITTTDRQWMIQQARLAETAVCYEAVVSPVRRVRPLRRPSHVRTVSQLH